MFHFHCSLTSPPTGTSLQINKPRQSISINKRVWGLELPGMGALGQCAEGLSLLPPSAGASNALYRPGAQLWTPEVQRSVLNTWGRGRKCSLRLITSSHVHNSQNKQFSPSANCGCKSALASSVLIQPPHICIFLPC